MKCVHGNDMGRRCEHCAIVTPGFRSVALDRVTVSQESTEKVKCDDIEFGDPIVQIALHQSSVKRMDDTVQELSRNVAGLTGVARALLALGTEMRMRREAFDPNGGSQFSKAVQEAQGVLHKTAAKDASLPEVKRGPVTFAELTMVNDSLGGANLTPFGEDCLERGLNRLLKSRGVL